jgi:hypothetical protein
MMDRITKALTAEKYHLPKVGQYTGAQLAEMLETSNAPAATVEAFRKYVVYATLNAPKRIVIQPETPTQQGAKIRKTELLRLF